ncbi:MAG TPA: FxDxF family PEP-CTERM protein, partial [Burkholderiaceae bacterium]|nr:FxDxF family PEP-CTERM protein [Burkholderiaceae bacterium]
ADWVDVTGQVTASIAGDMATFTLEPKHTVTFTDFTASPVQVAFNSTSPANQNADTVLNAINASGLFGLPGANISFVGGGDAVVSGKTKTLSISQPPHFDYLAVHFADGEMLFHWTQAAANPFVITSDKLSDYRAYTSPVPEPETYGMLLAGLGLVGFLARRRKAA